MRNQLRQIIEMHGRLSKTASALSDDSDLFAAGLDSLAVVNVMLAIENEFAIEFHDGLLTRQSFSSIAALEHAVRSSQAPGA